MAGDGEQCAAPRNDLLILPFPWAEDTPSVAATPAASATIGVRASALSSVMCCMVATARHPGPATARRGGIPPSRKDHPMARHTVTDVNTDKLVKLGDTDLTIADPLQDIRGRKVVDRNGEDIGHVDALMIDQRERKVRFLRVASGGFLGIGEKTFLLPVDAVRRVGPDEVAVDMTRDRLVGAPEFDPTLIDDRNYYGDLYGYYGYSPYWTPDYVYPTYPYLP
jgi:sporulation protein YlmC with PRC-barrel domain